jgi:CRISPR/Cas system-associated exonuclease Cas4 (RecB family)
VKKLKISYSKISSYLNCPQKHYFSYIQRIKSKKTVRPLSFGSDFHKLLENRYDDNKIQETIKNIQEKYDNLDSESQLELGDSYIEDLKTILNDYNQVYQDTDKPIKMEHEFLIKVGVYKKESIYFNGIIDEIYENLTIGEHKTFNRQPDMSILAMNTQVCLYSKAYELEFGNKIQRVQWDYIKSNPADYPVWLEKSHRFSDAASQKVTNLSWLRACDERGITDQDIRNKAEKYRCNLSNFFFRCCIEIVPQMVDTVWDNFKNIIKDMVIRGESNKVKNINMNCSFCEYRPLCYAEFTGLDTKYVLDKDYIIKEGEK